MLRNRDSPVCLADGRHVWLRPLGAADADGLMALRGRLSAETVRRRFLRLQPPCDPRLAFALANVDQQQRVAIAAVPAPDARGPILAVGRFHADADSADGQGDGDGERGPRRAELALLVEDAYQRQGLGRALLQRIVDEAAHRALGVLYGYTLYDNRPALRLLRTSGHPLHVAWHGGDVLSIELNVQATG